MRDRAAPVSMGPRETVGRTRWSEYRRVLGGRGPGRGPIGALVVIVLLGLIVLPGPSIGRATIPAPSTVAVSVGAAVVGPAVVGPSASPLGATQWVNLTTKVAATPCPDYWDCYSAWDPALDGIVVLSYSATGAGSMLLYQNGSFRAIDATTLPPMNFGGGLVYDVGDGYLVLFGGFDHSGALVNWTWIYAGTTWTELSPGTSPPTLTDFAMAYDPALSEVVLFGGSSGSNPFNTTWLFRAGDWSPGPALPSAAFSGTGLAYDAATGAMILVGGLNANGQYTNATWQLTGSGWAPVETGSGSDLSAGLYDLVPSPTGTGLLAISTSVLGIPLVAGESWLYESGTWTNVTSEVGRSALEGGVAVATDPVDNTTLLLGGFINTISPNPIEYPIIWALRAPLHLAGRTDPSGAVVSVDRPIDLIAQTSGGVGGYQYNWTSVPAGCAPAPISGNRSNPAELVCEEGKVGNYTATVSVSDLADGPVETNLTFSVVSALTVQAPVASHVGADVGEAVTFTVPIAGGVAPWTVAWAGLPSGCLGSTGATVVCLPETTGTSTVTATVTDATGTVATSGSLTFTVSGDLGVGVPVVGAPGAVTETDVGRWANVTVALLAPGGGGPYTYAWTGLPTGCAGSDAAMVACRPTAPGLTSIAVTVTDANGVAATSGATALLVNRNLTVEPVLVSGTATMAEPSMWLAVVSGGTGPYTIDWSVGGTEIGTGATLSYTFNRSGPTTVTVEVTDAAGSTMFANRTVTVVVGLAIPTTSTSTAGTGLTAGEVAALVAAVALALVAIGLGAFVLVRRPRPPSAGAPPAAEPPKGPA